MRDKDHRRKDGISLAKGPVGLIGIALIAAGVLGFIFAGNGFTANPIDGNVNGKSFLGFEANGWTNVLLAGSGLLLLLGSPFHWGAKTTAIIVGLVLGAASVISMVDGSDVFGIFAANGPTQLLLGAAAAALLILSLLPRVGKKDRHHDDDVRYRDRDREVYETERHGRFQRETEPVGREREIARERELAGPRDRTVVAPADGDGIEDRGRETYDRRERF